MFSKDPTTVSQQLEILEKRGLEIDDKALATHYLSNVNYYRLGEYWYSLQSDKEKHEFKPGSKFSEAISLYEFDRELRILLFDIIERIEISLRTKLIYYLSHEFNAWWFQNFDIFSDNRALAKTLASIDGELFRTKEKTISEHFKKYKNDGRFPPSWKTLEQTSFGTLSKLYGNLKNTVSSKDKIAHEFGAVNHTFLPSWLQSIAQIRNYCAHHSRLWNKNLPGKPKLLHKAPFEWIEDIPEESEFKNLYIHLCLMKYLLNIIHPGNDFTQRLSALLTKYPTVDPKALGMKTNWTNEKLWKK
ncbi:TPA: Abi family protein [Elizabethkingia anophelis]